MHACYSALVQERYSEAYDKSSAVANCQNDTVVSISIRIFCDMGPANYISTSNLMKYCWLKHPRKHTV